MKTPATSSGAVPHVILYYVSFSDQNFQVEVRGMQPLWLWKIKLDLTVATAVTALSDTFLLKSLHKWYAQ